MQAEIYEHSEVKVYFHELFRSSNPKSSNFNIYIPLESCNSYSFVFGKARFSLLYPPLVQVLSNVHSLIHLPALTCLHTNTDPHLSLPLTEPPALSPTYTYTPSPLSTQTPVSPSLNHLLSPVSSERVEELPVRDGIAEGGWLADHVSELIVGDDDGVLLWRELQQKSVVVAWESPSCLRLLSTRRHRQQLLWPQSID